MVNIANDIKKASAALMNMKAEKLVLEKSLESYRENIAKYGQDSIDIEKARAMVQFVANKLQKGLEERIVNIVNLALSSVFDDPYEFKVVFVTRRNQTECDMFFVKNGNECEPMEASGGGPLDIASLALRMAIWSIKKTRALHILDEPAKFLSRDMQDKASDMLHLLSEELGIQLIIVSHIPEMITAADRVFEVKQTGGVSAITERWDYYANKH